MARTYSGQCVILMGYQLKSKGSFVCNNDIQNES